MKRLIIILSLFFILSLMGWLFLGIYSDREFGNNYLFIKNSPTFKFFFFAPIGESDTKFENLTPAQQYEESMYKQYVENGGGYQRSIYIN